MSVKYNIISILTSVFILGLTTIALAQTAEPKITFKQVDVKEISFKEAKVEFVFDVENPNTIDLSNLNIAYELFLGFKDIPKDIPATAKGDGVTFSIKANTKSEFRLPMTVSYEGLFKSSAELANMLIQGKKTVPFVLKTNFKLNLFIFQFNIPILVQAELPLPEVSASPVQGIQLKF